MNEDTTDTQLRRSQRLRDIHNTQESIFLTTLLEDIDPDFHQDQRSTIQSIFAATENNIDIEQYLPEPRSYRALMKLKPKISEQWLKAAKSEISQLINVGSFDPNTSPSSTDQVIPTMMLFKAKVNSKGFLDKLKCRCVARGDLQHDLPDEETWSSTVASLTMKLFFANAAKLGQKVRQLDYVGAFLQAKCKNRIFIRLPIEYAKHYPEYAKYFGKPLLLKKTIYGLTVSAKWWSDE